MKQIITLCSVTFLLFTLFINSCSERQGITTVYKERPPAVLTYDTDIKPILDGSCIGCHSSGLMLGSYNLSSYAGVLGNGTDATPNAIPGDANSLLITKLAGGHQSVSQPNQDMIFQWVVVDSLKEN
ncbi:hypothetical protein JNL27_02520 [bacterium]|nr:hypothetical protein [bacterium]